MKKIIIKLMMIVLAAVISLGSFTACGGGDGGKNTNKTVPEFNGGKQFRIFADCPPAPEEDILIAYKETGFNMYNMTEDDVAFTDENGIITDEYAGAIELCEELGLDVIIRNYRSDVNYFINDDPNERRFDTVFGPIYYTLPIRNITTELTDMPAVKGFYMVDEPSYDYISEIAKIIDWYHSYGGNNYFHINLNASYGGILFPGYTWEEYLDYYIETLLSKVNGPKNFGIDYYPLKTNSTGTVNYVEEEYLYNYFVVAQKTKEMNLEIETDANKVQTSFCIQAYKEPNVRWLTSSRDISFQTNMAAAFGAKTFEYYLYRGLQEDDGMVGRASHKINPLYYYVQTANKEMAGVADAILSFDWVGAKVYAGEQVVNEYNARAFEQVKDLQLEKFEWIESIKCRLDTVVSEFEDKDGNNAYMILNYAEPSSGMTDYVNVKLGGATKAVVYIKGEREVVNLSDGILNLKIGAGDAAFVYPVAE